MVSLLTLSQYRRMENLFLLKDMILEQTYLDKVIEWVIVDGSDKEYADMSVQIDLLRTQINIPIVFVPYEKGALIGKLRNKSNKAAKGDILVCLDDDDYYPPERIQEAYDNLIKSDWLIAGVSATYMYDYVFNKQYKFNSFGEYHSPNNSMAYKKEYIINHTYDETVTHNEEISFTNKFSEPLIQLNSLKTVNISSHQQNTFNKRQLIVYFHQGLYHKLFDYEQCMIPAPYFEKMKAIFIKNKVNLYDIVYFCGESIKWDPNDESLGGSEQAVKYLTQEWAKMGKKVAVYGHVDNTTYKGVDYFDWKQFPYNESFKIIVVWRLIGLSGTNFFPIKAEKFYLDLHDNALKFPTFPMEISKFERNVRPFDKIIFKSYYHKACYEGLRNIIMRSNEYLIIPNGLRVEEFKSLTQKCAEPRNPYRFCYCSSYSRGLDNILKCVWPEIVKLEPRAELHLYYGMIHEKEDYQKYIRLLISSSKNVMDHGREPLELIVREKTLSTYQLYLNACEGEIDCINIREGLLCGCIPIISDTIVFKERDGLHMKNINFFTDDSKQLSFELAQAGRKIGYMVANILPEQIDEMRDKLSKSKLLIDWTFVANAWLIEKHYFTGEPINCCDNIGEYTSYALSLLKSLPITYINKLLKMKEEGFEPKVIYDIGACVKHFTNVAQKIWPNAKIILFEAYPQHEFLYKKDGDEYHIGCMSNSDENIVDFYSDECWVGGNSYYREIGSPVASYLYNDNSYIKLKTCKLDTVVKNKKFPPPDLIKIDTQGSELDILEGGQNSIKNCTHLLVELQHTEYNKGAKLIGESIQIIEKYGFENKGVFSATLNDADYHFSKK